MTNHLHLVSNFVNKDNFYEINTVVRRKYVTIPTEEIGHRVHIKSQLAYASQASGLSPNKLYNNATIMRQFEGTPPETETNRFFFVWSASSMW